jgi:hypothetical protein
MLTATLLADGKGFFELLIVPAEAQLRRRWGNVVSSLFSKTQRGVCGEDMCCVAYLFGRAEGDRSDSVFGLCLLGKSLGLLRQLLS